MDNVWYYRSVVFSDNFINHVKSKNQIIIIKITKNFARTHSRRDGGKEYVKIDATAIIHGYNGGDRYLCAP